MPRKRRKNSFASKYFISINRSKRIKIESNHGEDHQLQLQQQQQQQHQLLTQPNDIRDKEQKQQLQLHQQQQQQLTQLNDMQNEQQQQQQHHHQQQQQQQQQHQLLTQPNDIQDKEQQQHQQQQQQPTQPSLPKFNMVGGDASRCIQVLNISNVNAQGKTVLNDGKLLQLIHQYPFLYNARVKAYGDMDYALWAWKRINAAFNRSYENDPSAAFSTSDLMNRWLVLKPLIQCLSKAYGLAAIPPALRHNVLKISTELNDPRTNCSQKPCSLQQAILQHRMPDIEKLPREDRLALESEVLDLIFSTEIESKQLKKLDDNEMSQVKQEADEFLNDIGFKQVLLTALSQQTKMVNNLANCKVELNLNSDTKYLTKNKWYPISEAKKHTRQCIVKMKRMNLEDYLSLSNIVKLEENII